MIAVERHGHGERGDKCIQLVALSALVPFHRGAKAQERRRCLADDEVELSRFGWSLLLLLLLLCRV